MSKNTCFHRLFQIFFNLGAILAHQTSNGMFSEWWHFVWHPWGPWMRVNSRKKGFSGQTATVPLVSIKIEVHLSKTITSSSKITSITILKQICTGKHFKITAYLYRKLLKPQGTCVDFKDWNVHEIKSTMMRQIFCFLQGLF